MLRIVVPSLKSTICSPWLFLYNKNENGDRCISTGNDRKTTQAAEKSREEEEAAARPPHYQIREEGTWQE